MTVNCWKNYMYGTNWICVLIHKLTLEIQLLQKLLIIEFLFKPYFNIVEKSSFKQYTQGFLFYTQHIKLRKMSVFQSPKLLKLTSKSDPPSLNTYKLIEHSNFKTWRKKNTHMFILCDAVGRVLFFFMRDISEQ